jgi:hypothetical protein
MSYTLSDKYEPNYTTRLSDEELGRKVRDALRTGCNRVEVYGKPGSEKINTVKVSRKHSP